MRFYVHKVKLVVDYLLMKKLLYLRFLFPPPNCVLSYDAVQDREIQDVSFSLFFFLSRQDAPLVGEELDKLLVVDEVVPVGVGGRQHLVRVRVAQLHLPVARHNLPARFKGWRIWSREENVFKFLR